MMISTSLKIEGCRFSPFFTNYRNSFCMEEGDSVNKQNTCSMNDWNANGSTFV